MNERSQITYMQVRIVRMATEKLNLSVAEVARLFDQYQVFEFIRDCFDIFRCEGDAAIWEDVVPFLKTRGDVFA